MTYSTVTVAKGAAAGAARADDDWGQLQLQLNRGLDQGTKLPRVCVQCRPGLDQAWMLRVLGALFSVVKTGASKALRTATSVLRKAPWTQA